MNGRAGQRIVHLALDVVEAPRSAVKLDHHPHRPLIALAETGLPYKLVSLDRNERTDDGRDFMAINPRGFVPALALDDGTILTENLAILVYIAGSSST